MGFDLVELTPSCYNKESQLLELFLVSQAYWALAKAFDRSARNYGLLTNYLDRFVLFSLGMKYQYVSWQLVKRFNKKNIAYFPKSFREAEKRLRQGIDSCFIASYLFGESDEYTEIFRSFKRTIQKYYLGDRFIDWYYGHSPAIVEFFRGRGKVVNFLIKKLFIFLAELIKRVL